MKPKSIIALLLGLIIVIVSACNILPERTNKWKTYKNEEYGYSFEYPLDCFYGPMPSDCKQKPPEERRQECLCFLNGENPKDVFIQTFLGEKEKLSLATISVRYLEFVPGVVDLVSWLKSSQYTKNVANNIPDAPNTQLGEIPAVRVYFPPSPGVPSSEKIFYIQYNRLFEIGLLDVDDTVNRAFYDQILSTFEHSTAPKSEKGMLLP